MTKFMAFILTISCLAQTPGGLMTAKQFQALPTKAADERISYGKEIDQFGELRVPAGTGPHPVVILIHGGCWRADFSNLHEMGPIADALKAKGVATWTLNIGVWGNQAVDGRAHISMWETVSIICVRLLQTENWT